MNQPHPRPGRRPQPSPTEVAYDSPREWFEFARPEGPEHIITCDLTQLMSSYQYTFGTSACRGIDSADADIRCCGHGAFIADGEDRERVIDVVKQMEGDSAESQWWQNRPEQTLKWLETYETDPSEPLEPWLVWDELGDGNGEPESALKTKVVKNACIFANRDGWQNSAGCAIRRWAIVNDIDPMKVKSDVCW